jgi:ribokinase
VANGVINQKILVVGSANVDLVFRTAKLPRTGETVLGDSFSTHPGGKGANQAVAIGRLGATVDFVGCVGSDAFGTSIDSSLTSAHVGIKHLAKVDDVSTGTAGIYVDDQGRNMIVVAAGANCRITADQVRVAIEEVSPAIVLTQLETPEPAVLAAAQCRRFVLNPAPVRDIPDEVLRRCYLITPNETELEALTGIPASDIDSCRAGCRKLLERGAENVIVTLGERGCYWQSATNGGHFPAPHVDPIDTTAAGDVFNGALVRCLAKEMPFEESIQFANVAAAISTTRHGAQESAPDLETVTTFLAQSTK